MLPDSRQTHPTITPLQPHPILPCLRSIFVHHYEQFMGDAGAGLEAAADTLAGVVDSYRAADGAMAATRHHAAAAAVTRLRPRGLSFV